MNETDKELLELAMEAAGVKATWNEVYRTFFSGNDLGQRQFWDPLSDDGDALRLAVKLGIHVMHSKRKVKAGQKLIGDGPCEEDKGDDPCAATRRAIVRVAAKIGETK